MYESLHEASSRCTTVATSRTEALLTSVFIAGRQVERTVDARVTLQTNHETFARALTSDVTARIH